MNIIKTAREMQSHSDNLRRQGKTIAFVPTMGFLHDGHLSLIKEGLRLADEVVLSIFVNPTQFAPDEDLDAYPRDMERDIKLARETGASVIFFPKANGMYPDGFQTYVTLEKLPGHLCGISRPIHFRGVATVVTKLFNIVKPHVAVFGLKDYQQYLVIKRMARDLNFDIEVVGAPIVREPDGLAMSSRNKYLTPDQRNSALSLSRSLEKAREMASRGIKETGSIIKAAEELILSKPDTIIDYIAIRDPETLEETGEIRGSALMALAVKVGKTRLIDNTILNP